MYLKRQEESKDGIEFQFQELSSSLSRKRHQASLYSSMAGYKAKKKKKEKQGTRKWLKKTIFNLIHGIGKFRSPEQVILDWIPLVKNSTFFSWVMGNPQKESVILYIHGGTCGQSQKRNKKWFVHLILPCSHYTGWCWKVAGAINKGTQDMTSLCHSMFDLKSKLANLLMVNNTNIDHTTAQSKITS